MLVDEELKRRKEQESAAKEALKNHEFTFAHNGFEPTPEGLKAYAESLKTMPKSDLKKELSNVSLSLGDSFREWAREAKKYWKPYEITEFYDLEYRPLEDEAFYKYEEVVVAEIDRRDQEVKDMVHRSAYASRIILHDDAVKDYKNFLHSIADQKSLEDELKNIPHEFEKTKETWKILDKDKLPSELQDEYQEAVFAKFDEYQKEFEQAATSEIARRQRKANLGSQGTLKVTKVEPYAPDISSFPEEFAGSFEVVDDEIGGSTGAKLVKDANGAHYIMKRGTSEEHIVNEARADAFYQAAGVKVPAFKLYDDGTGAPVKISAEIKNAKPLDEWWNDASEEERSEMQKKIRKDFAVDVLMGNWDVVGDGDVNILVDSEGTPWRIDNGCSMGFRGRGDRKPKEMWGEFCDDLFTMTGNGAAIGKNVWTRIPEFFGEMRPLDLAIEIASRDWTQALATLSDDDAEVVEKRLAEIRQIAERGAENEKFGRTKESTDEVVAFSYQMCKDGLREALNMKIDLNAGNLSEWETESGWFKHGNETKTLNGKDYGSLGEYLADKMGEEGFNFITEANKEQGGDSYYTLSVRRKLCVLKSQGFECTDPKYQTFDDFAKDLGNAGYFYGALSDQLDAYRDEFEFARYDPDDFEERCKAANQYDAAIQLILENVEMENVDPKTRTVILGRNEGDDVVQDESGNEPSPGSRTFHRTGSCESHYRVSPIYFKDHTTVVRVPFSRIHGLWILERGMIDSNGYNPKSEPQFAGKHENEVVADTHGLAIIYAGENADIQTSHDYLEEYENDNPDEVVTGALFDDKD